jgi:hypothetical protein
VIKKSIIISFALIGTWTFTTAFFFSSCQGNQEKSDGEGLRHFKVSPIALDSAAGWGYRILDDTIPVIEQRFIPGVQGSTGFKTKDQALKTGVLVVSKLNKGIWPPTITTQELDSLGITYQH